MKTKNFGIFISLILVLGLIVGGCSQGTTPTTPATSTTPSIQTITLTFASPFPPGSLNISDQWWMDQVEKQSGGKVKFNRVFGGTLGSLENQPMALKTGAFDIGSISSVYSPGVYPLSTVMILPFIGSSEAAFYKASWDFEQRPEIIKEYTGLNQKYLYDQMWASLEMISHEPITTVDQLRKLKIRATGGAADALKAINITTYGVPFEELAAAAQTGVVDAVIMGTPADIADGGFGDIFKYWDRMTYFYFPMTTAINLDTWNKLPADIQKVINDVSAQMPSQAFKIYNTDYANKAWASLEKIGWKQVQFNPAEKEYIVTNGSKPVWESWIKDMNSRGLPGQATFDAFTSLIKKYESAK